MEWPPGAFAKNLLCKGWIQSSKIRTILRDISAFVICSLYCCRLNNPPTPHTRARAAHTHTSYPNPGNLWISIYSAEKGLCRYNEVKDFDRVDHAEYLAGSDVITKVLIMGMPEESKLEDVWWQARDWSDVPAVPEKEFEPCLQARRGNATGPHPEPPALQIPWL